MHYSVPIYYSTHLILQKSEFLNSEFYVTYVYMKILKRPSIELPSDLINIFKSLTSMYSRFYVFYDKINGFAILVGQYLLLSICKNYNWLFLNKHYSRALSSFTNLSLILYILLMLVKYSRASFLHMFPHVQRFLRLTH